MSGARPKSTEPVFFALSDTSLQFWQRHFGLKEYTEAAFAPYFAQAEQRLNISPCLPVPNQINELLRRGAIKLGIAAETIARNVKGFWNLGFCGRGYLTHAQQSMRVTTVPAARDLGAQLLPETRAERFELRHGQVSAFICRNVEPNSGLTLAGCAQAAIKIIAKNPVLEGAAINAPAALLRDKFHEKAPGGKVKLRSDGSAVLDTRCWRRWLEARPLT